MAEGGARRESDDELVISMHGPSIMRFCRANTRCVEDAEDAYQETFKRFLERRGRELRNPKGWLLSAASHACVDHYRNRARSEQRACEGIRLESPDPEGMVVNRVFAREVLDHLGRRDRTVLFSLHMKGESIEQLAERLHLTPPTLRVVALRARKRAMAAAVALGHFLGGIIVLGPLRRLRERLRSSRRRCGQQTWAHPALAQVTSDAFPVLVVVIGLFPIAAGSPVADGPFGVPSAVGTLQGAGGPAPVDPGTLRTVTLAGQLRAGPTYYHGARLPNGIAAGSGEPGPGGAVGGGFGPATGDLGAGSASGGSLGTSDPVATASGPVNGATQGFLPPAAPTPHDATFSSLTAAPDGTTFASGEVMPCVAPCSTLFVSRDLGYSWQHLAARGFLGGRIVLPPDFPANPTIFAAGPGGLQRSDDRGGLFRTVVPTTAPAAADPTSPPGDARIAIGQLPLAVYDQSSGLLSPGPVLPPGTRGVSDVAYTAGGDLIVAGSEVSPTARGQAAAVVALCSALATSCTIGITLPTASSFHLSVPTTLSATHMVTLFGADRLYRSDDDGRHFQGGRVDGINAVGSTTTAPDFATSGALIVAAARADPASSVLLRGTGTLVPMTITGLPSDALLSQVLSLPGGRLLAAVVFDGKSGRVGIPSSSDGGFTWERG